MAMTISLMPCGLFVIHGLDSRIAVTGLFGYALLSSTSVPCVPSLVTWKPDVA
jgi:hypothetical protein